MDIPAGSSQAAFVKGRIIDRAVRQTGDKIVVPIPYQLIESLIGLLYVSLLGIPQAAVPYILIPRLQSPLRADADDYLFRLRQASRK